MINLLPNEDKKKLRAARRNTIWVRYSLFLVAALLALNIVTGAVALMIQIDKGSIEAKIQENNTTKLNANAESVKKSIEALKGDLKIAKDLVDAQPRYLFSIINFYSAIPKNCTHSSITAEQLTPNKEYSINLDCKYPEDTPTVNTKAALASYVGTQLTRGLGFKDSVITSIKESGESNTAYPFALVYKTTSQDPREAIKPHLPEGCSAKLVLALESPKKIAMQCDPLVVQREPFKDPVFENQNTLRKRISDSLTTNKSLQETVVTSVQIEHLPGKPDYKDGDDFSAFIVFTVNEIET